ncbi:hypothetical protein M409DRAFT_19420 [Zasmidium cellare ATCC 36951]|uniref:Cytochrome P450 n=1 Tax=Zasmidium cellare ATCC 36951 TaxID=1080233 RepID=A0A6A6CV59_ZASCE|nr:uncharacterized protein M409DRAFT_19420 [Zasmidium cellare ATCC 36951]KAF2170603.1 hypothetical protein M409DRAFT_19420 [Zasmidium cellare ATCC 36951]
MEKLWLWIGAAGLLALLVYIWTCISYDADLLPKGLAWGGYKLGSWFVIPRASFSEIWLGHRLLQKGYEDYGKHGQPWLAPNRTWDHQVMLPPEHSRWVVDQPDSVLHPFKPFLTDLGFLYFFLPPEGLGQQWTHDFRKMDWAVVADDISAEVAASTRRFLGSRPGATVSFDLNDTLQTILSNVGTRVFLGPEMAQNEEFLKFTMKRMFGYILPASLYLRTITPLYLQYYLLWPLFQLPVRYYEWRVRRSLRPIIKSYLAAAQTAKDEGKELKAPTILETIARIAVESPDPRDHRPDKLTRRVLMYSLFEGLNVGIQVLATIAISTLPLILIDGPDLWNRLRAEAEAVQATGPWTKTSVSRLVLLDSVLREGARLTPVKVRNIERMVAAEEGVTLPNGLHVQRGVAVGLPSSQIHTDDQFYPDGEKFIADRFVGKEGETFASVSQTYQVFGIRGKHVCPGRFVAAHLVKVFFAYLVLHYDFDQLKKQPGGLWISDHYFPSTVTVTCRRREQEGDVKGKSEEHDLVTGKEKAA